jgi:hypothetical protein
MNIDEELKSVVRDSAANATDLLAYVADRADRPLVAMTSLLLASAVFAKSIGMAQENFLEGCAAVYNSLEEGTGHATH